MIQNVLGISTSHISGETANWLNKQVKSCKDLVIYSKEDYGWFIPMYEDIVANKDIPKDLSFVINYAADNGCSWIIFDRDIKQKENLPRYDW